MIKTEANRPIDASPIRIQEFQVGNEKVVADPTLVFDVVYHSEDECCTLDGELGIFLYGFSRQELEESLEEFLQSLWLEYALEENDKLAASGMVLKEKLLKRLRQK